MLVSFPNLPKDGFWTQRRPDTRAVCLPIVSPKTPCLRIVLASKHDVTEWNRICSLAFQLQLFWTELDARAGARNVSDQDTSPIWDCFKVEWLWSHGTVARDSWAIWERTNRIFLPRIIIILSLNDRV